MPSKNSLTNVKAKSPILTSNSDLNIESKPKKAKSKKDNVVKRLQLLLTVAEFEALEEKAGIAGAAAYLRNEIRTKTDFLK